MNSKEKIDFKYGMEGLSDEELLLVDNFKFSFNITNDITKTKIYKNNK